MNRRKLTETFVQKVEAKPKTCIYWDTAIVGLGLKVTNKGHKSYLIRTRCDRKQYNRSLKQADRVKLVKARSDAKSILGRIAQGENPFVEINREFKTLTQLCELFIEEYATKFKKPRSIEGDRAMLNNHIIPWLGALQPEKVTRQHIIKFTEAVADGRTAKKAKSKVRGVSKNLKGGKICANRCLALLSKIFNFGITEGHLRRFDNPVHGVRRYKEKLREEFLDKEQISALRSAFRYCRKNRTHKFKAIYVIELLLLTGARRSEINALRFEEVFLNDSLIKKIDTKVGARNIPLSKRALYILGRLKKRRRPGEVYVFSNEKGEPLCIRKTWKYLKIRAGLPDAITINSLRHTFASHAAMRGKSEYQIGNILGHKSTQTTKRYVKIGREAGREDVNDIVDGMFERN